jgi:hypothetical protein
MVNFENKIIYFQKMKINKEMCDGINRYIKSFEKDPESHIR